MTEDEVGQRLLSIPCVGTLTASTISTEIGGRKQYASSREFAAATGGDLDNTARAGGQYCLASASGATRRYKPCQSSAPEYLYKNRNSSQVGWSTGSESYCAGKVTLS